LRGPYTELFVAAVVRAEKRLILCSTPYIFVSPHPKTFSYAAEIGRKTLHLLALIIPFGMWWLDAPLALYVVGSLAVIGILADITRAYSPAFNKWIRGLFGPLMRLEELPPVGTGIIFNGATCVLVGAALLVFIFPIRVAVPILTMTMLADAAAALVGRRMGYHPWGRLSATVEGSAAFVITGLLVMPLFPVVAFGPALASVVVAAVVEALPVPINDNIRVPVMAAGIFVGTEAFFFDQPLHLFASLPT